MEYSELKNYGDVSRDDRSIWTRVKQSHMGNFFKCIKSGAKPISDVVTVGAGTISCHLANIALRLDRRLTWDPAAETFVGDDEANAMLARPQREGYEIKV